VGLDRLPLARSGARARRAPVSTPVVRTSEALGTDELQELCAGYPFGDYRRYRSIEPQREHAHFVERVRQLCARDDVRRLVACDPDGAPAGLLLLQHLDDDSRLFGLRMAGIPIALARADHPNPRAVQRALLAGLSSLVERERVLHVSFRVDTADLAAYQEFTDAGFRLVETLVTLTHDTERRGRGVVLPAEHGFEGVLRAAEPRDLPAIEELSARAFTLNRYHLDEHLPRRDAGRLMARWARNYLELSLAPERDAQVWVAETSAGRLAGFLGHRLERELERHTGVLVSGRALLAVADPRSGVGRMLSQHHVWTSSGAYKDADTQLNNYGMIKVAFDLDMELVRTKYTFHRWYGG